MSLEQPVYLIASKNLEPFLNALRQAQAPGKVSLRFIEDLGFKSTNDRLLVTVLKAMKFLDDAGKPTARYHSFLDDSEWKRVLAEGVRDAYPELFRINKSANTFSREQLTGKLKSLGEGKLSPAILGNVTRTFLELVKLADFSASVPPSTETPPDTNRKPAAAETDSVVHQRERPPEGSIADAPHPGPTLVYRIEIVLPSVRDQAIYDAIFRSAREHLLK